MRRDGIVRVLASGCLPSPRCLCRQAPARCDPSTPEQGRDVACACLRTACVDKGSCTPTDEAGRGCIPQPYKYPCKVLVALCMRLTRPACSARRRPRDGSDPGRHQSGPPPAQLHAHALGAAQTGKTGTPCAAPYAAWRLLTCARAPQVCPSDMVNCELCDKHRCLACAAPFRLVSGSCRAALCPAPPSRGVLLLLFLGAALSSVSHTDRRCVRARRLPARLQGHNTGHARGYLLAGDRRRRRQRRRDRCDWRCAPDRPCSPHTA